MNSKDNEMVDSLAKEAIKRENASREELEKQYTTATGKTTLGLCEYCGKVPATEIVEQETGGYSHWDGYVYTVEYRLCKDCCLSEKEFFE